MYPGLQAYVLRISAEATEPILLDQHPGSSLRGALLHALLRRFCMEPTSHSCAECQLNATCPVAGLAAPLRDENPRGRDVPRPFVLAVAPSSATRVGTDQEQGLQYTDGGTLAFDMSLFGTAVTYFPYLALSMPALELLGMGRWVSELGRRGRPQIKCIECLDPFGDQTEALYVRGEKTVRSPTLAVNSEMIAARAIRFPVSRLTVHFLTPTRLIADGQIMHTPHMHVLAQRLLERLDALDEAYGSEHDADPSGEHRRARYHEVSELARGVRMVANETRWVDVTSYSARQRRTTPIGGFVGRATYEGDLTQLRDLLAWGEIVHVGKNTVKGDGLYCVEW